MKNQFKICTAIFILFSSNVNAAHSNKHVDNKTVSSNPQKHIKELSEQKTSSNPTFDFIKADSPFKYDFIIAGQPANIQLYGVIDIARARTNHSLPANYELPNNLYPYAGAKVNPAVKSRSDWVNGGLQDSRLGLKGEIGQFKITDNTFKFNGASALQPQQPVTQAIPAAASQTTTAQGSDKK